MSNAQKSFSESGTSPPRHVTVTRMEITVGCTTSIGHGVDTEGRPISFGCDWRPGLAIAESLEAGHHVEVWLAGWQIIAWDATRRS